MLLFSGNGRVFGKWRSGRWLCESLLGAVTGCGNGMRIYENS